MAPIAPQQTNAEQQPTTAATAGAGTSSNSLQEENIVNYKIQNHTDTLQVITLPGIKVKLHPKEAFFVQGLYNQIVVWDNDSALQKFIQVSTSLLLLLISN